MNAESELLQRVTRLEIQLQTEKESRIAEVAELKAEVAELEKKLGYYDKMALKWGSFCLGFLSLGALLWAGVDKLKDKVLSWLP